VPLARLLRLSYSARGPARQTQVLVDRPEPARPARRDHDERRRIRRRLVHRCRGTGPLSQHRTGLERPQPAPSSRGTSGRPCSSRTFAPRPGLRVSRRTVIPSATGAGSGCTTASSATSRGSSATSFSRSTKRLYPSIEGSADSEVLFHLALTLGLEEDPPSAVARMVGFVEETGRRHGVEHPIQMTIATTDGKELWGFRYSSEAGRAPSTTAPKCGPCGSSTPSFRCSMRCRTRPGSSSPSRSAI
jgi:hypothetical protein